MLKEYFGEHKICKTINPQEAVAYGAAIKAAMLSNKRTPELENMTISDVTPLSLGIETKGGVISIPNCFWRNSYTTTRDNQITIRLLIYEGESAKATENNLLGHFDVHGILPAPAGVPKVDVCFDIDGDGILTVSALDRISKGEGRITITNERGKLSEERIRKIITEAERFKEDAKWKRRAIALNDVESFAYDIQRSVHKGSVRNEINEATLLRIEDKCDDVMNWIKDNRDGDAELAELLGKKEELESLCHPVFSSLCQSASMSSSSSQKSLQNIYIQDLGHHSFTRPELNDFFHDG